MLNESFNILVAEDDADDRFMLQTAFDECEYDGILSFVENGVEAMNYLFDAKQHGKPFPNLILLDINMPKKDGYEVLRELKADDSFSVIPVVVFSTTHNEREMEKCSSLGADQYIVKPDKFETLLQIIAELNSRFKRASGILQTN